MSTTDSPPEPSHVEWAVETATSAVKAASVAALPHFRSGVRVELKVDRSPVTAADLDAERAALAVLDERDPGATVVAEESGLHARSKTRRWYVDPIDGTRGFARGGEFWGPLVALEENGSIVAAAMALPARNQIYWAGLELGAWRDGVRLSVSGIRDWDEATLSLGEASRLVRGPHGPAVIALASTAASTRCLGDLAAVTLVLEGRAELWLEVGVKPWDLAPSRLLVEEAGGRWTTFDGGTDLTDGSAIGSNGHLHELALDRLRG